MRIEYICHACLLVDTGDVKIATDPWFVGSAYCDQWHVFPKPVNAGVLQKSDVVLLSHGHEDHFHERSLRSLPKPAHVFYPYSWYGGAKQFLQELGYSKVTEAIPQKRYQLTPQTAITYVVNGMDSIVVIESQGKVFVNVNDALHSYPPKIIELFVRVIKEKWPNVDAVFCGFGGASYFPNTIHCTGKNDIEIGQTREQLFAHNFCLIVHGLQPRVAVPFAADFALLGARQSWVNEVRFPRNWLADYYRRLFADDLNPPRIQVMYSGDVLQDTEFQQKSPYWQELRDGSLGHLIGQQYAEETATLNGPNFVAEEEAEIVRLEMVENIKRRTPLYDKATLASLAFTVKLTDVEHKPYFNVTLTDGHAEIQREHSRDAKAILQIETSSRILRYSFASDWGGDAITIGYGCDIEVFDPKTVEASLDTVCVRLLTRQPQASRHWRVEPVRIAKHLLTSPTTRTWVAKSFLGRSSEYSDKKTNDVMRQWLFRSKCEVCRACDLPLLDESFAAKL